MSEILTDNRFELINKYKKQLIDSTNIETSPDEMKVLNNLLFRIWQMGWFDILEANPHGKWNLIGDRMPDPHSEGLFLVTVKGDQEFITIAEYEPEPGYETWLFDDVDLYDDEVIAWMPLPETYRKEQTNE